MRFSKCLAKTFLMFAASGAGSMFGVCVVGIGAMVVAGKVAGFTKPTFEIIENEDKKDTE